MPRTTPTHYLMDLKRLTEFGERLRLARLRRKFTVEMVAKRAGISRPTLYRVEQGDASVAMGTYLRVLSVLGMLKDLDLLAKEDVLGRRLQDLELPKRREGP